MIDTEDIDTAHNLRNKIFALSDLVDSVTDHLPDNSSLPELYEFLGKW